jgi:hypothetical protein
MAKPASQSVLRISALKERLSHTAQFAIQARATRARSLLAGQLSWLTENKKGNHYGWNI